MAILGEFIKGVNLEKILLDMQLGEIGYVHTNAFDMTKDYGTYLYLKASYSAILTQSERLAVQKTEESYLIDYHMLESGILRLSDTPFQSTVGIDRSAIRKIPDENVKGLKHLIELGHPYGEIKLLKDMTIGQVGYIMHHDLIVDTDNRCWLDTQAWYQDEPFNSATLKVKRISNEENGFEIDIRDAEYVWTPKDKDSVFMINGDTHYVVMDAKIKNS